MWVNADEVLLIQAFNTRPAARERARAESSGQLYDATGGGKKRLTCRALVTLKNGVVVASPVHAETLTQRQIVEAPVVASTRRAAPPRETFEADLRDFGDATIHAAPKTPPQPQSAPPDAEDEEPERETKPPRRRGFFGLKTP